jgi:acetyltransferase-like isoleucine patch superfamily enzyme
MKDTAFKHVKAKKLGLDIEIGNDVKIESEDVTIGDGVHIGSESDEEAFRVSGGVRIRTRKLTIDDDTRISRGVLIKGGNITIGKRATVREYCTIDVRDKLVLGDGSYVNPYCRIMGRDIEIGSNFRMLTWASIGGGSCFEIHSKLRMGKNCHLGEFSFINTADEVVIGEEVGIGMRSAIFTHGAYQSFIKGYPVTFGPVHIEDNCWLPQAVVLPNITIGKGSVIATGSLVNRSLPAYCLAGGIPAKVLSENAFSEDPTNKEKVQLMSDFLGRLNDILVSVYGKDKKNENCRGFSYASGHCLWFVPELKDAALLERNPEFKNVVLAFSADEGARQQFKSGKGCLLVLDERDAIGNVDDFSNKIIDQLRRYGVRLK